jgi:glycosyltransferase involved in cell wall biosynthesis
LRLLTVTHYFPAHGGGIELVAGELVERFASTGLEVEWISSSTDPAPAQREHLRITPVGSLNLVERLTQLPYPLWWPGSIMTLIRAVGRADVVQVHEHFYFGSILSVLIARCRQRPVVVTQHMGVLDLGTPVLTWLFASYSRLMGRLMFSAASRVVFISANVRTFFGLDASPKACLIYNGVDAGAFGSTPSEDPVRIRAELESQGRRPIVLFVGRFVRKKGMSALRALIPRFPDVSWVFIGSGPEDPSVWNQGNVRVVGRVGHERLACYYHAADLLILPSAGEGFPLVVQEALACGLAVLSTDEVANACPEARAMIRSRPSPRVPDDIRSWEEAVRETLADTVYLTNRSERALRAGQLWSWSGCAAEYRSLFARLTSAARGSG